MPLNEKAIRKQARKFKKWLEKVFVFYPYQDGEDTYVLVRYSRFDRATGDLIVSSSGEVLPRDKAIPIFRNYTIYDTCISNAAEELVRDKDASIKTFEELHNLLTDVVEPVVPTRSAPSIQDDIDKILAMARAYIRGREQLRSVSAELEHIDRIVQEDRGYLTASEVEKVYRLYTDWEQINYDGLRKSRDALASFPRLQTFCKEHKEKINERRAHSVSHLDRLLKAFTKADNVEALHRSLQEFEKDEKGNPVTFSPGEKGFEELTKMTHRETEYTFHTDVLPLLRNP